MLAELFRERGLSYPPRELFLRAFKAEGELEVWARNPGATRFRLVKVYPVCRQSGVLGPKRREGDLQVPEGLYSIDRYNPRSRFYLSLGLDYPNDSDRILGDPDSPGSDIFIHGDCASVGCLAMGDDAIMEIYWLALQARDSGSGGDPANAERRHRVHMFPYRFGRAQGPPPGDFAAFRTLWEPLRAAHDFFEKNGFPPSYTVSSDGRYVIQEL